MALSSTAKELGAGMASAYRRYAEWLVSITWKRFIVLSILLLIIAAILSHIPPFNWAIGEHPVKVRLQPQQRSGSGDVDITVDGKGVQIRRKRDPAAAPKDSPQSQAPAQESESITDEIAREIEDEINSELGGGIKGRRVRSITLGEFLPNLAFLFIIVSAALKIAYAGRVKAEAKAAEAQEVADAESLKRQVVEAKMAAMQAQVEPHFLFNTLASIDHLIETDPPRASKMQKSLIALLRASMPAMREKTTNLGRELEVVRPYLDILQVRMEECLHAEIHVPEGLRSADFPPMMLQSLVENAIKHGLEPKANGGSLTVSAEVVHGKLAVTVADTGVGFARAPTAGTGTGLNNIRERLKLIYGDAAELKIAENTPSGTRVTIVVPYKAT